MSKDYYSILEIKPTSLKEEIYKAYKRLAKKYHPDKNKNPDAVNQFQNIQKAYSVLSDPEQKIKYDLTLTHDLSSRSSDFMPFYDDIINDFFFMKPTFFYPHTHAHTHPDEHHTFMWKVKDPLVLSLKDVYVGIEKKITLESHQPCSDCTCTHQHNIIFCHICLHKQQTYCLSCNNKKTVKNIKEITLVINPLETRNPIPIVYEQQNININVTYLDKDENYKKIDKQDLYLEKKISLLQALCGFTTIITTIDDRKLKIVSIPGDVIEPNSVMKINNEGLARQGYLIIKFIVIFPKKISIPIILQLKNMLSET
ncbi:putative DnaJ-like protein [Namao virus]|nr:putative DnaJ-like protein [Namao virus]